ncbi:hypothetical protein B5M43_004415 [Microbacterium sp. MEC084]|uniref:COG4315 family predicted lipoprotein n=1 Tax=Microbacterium sp. MEC084 TaxID=1963027 RepID=UPI00106FB537|nr:hypothetical protein [Microbacterium sp. MEC084]MCD1268093.1 hypothetical protein [Microbacterium sp. MEC084]
MRTRFSRRAAAVLLGATALATALAGCGGGTGDGPMSPGTDPYGSDGGETGTMGAVSLTTAETDLGTIVVDGEGKVVYQFDSDEQGAGVSTCEGQCLGNWPPVPGGEDVEAEGVTGEVGTITGVDGEPQLTLNGWPLYYFAGDQAAGDTNGQGVDEVWWVLDPAGEPIRD